MKRFILTGAPGSGKTAIIRQLELDGFSVVEEAATDVIAAAQARGIAEPWKHSSFLDEIAAGAICVADHYGGGWVAVLFTRRQWRGRGVGRALLQDAFARFWDRGERSVGLSVDADGTLGAFQLYESAGMSPALGWVMFEKSL